MTYGWAILVVLAAIGALAYFGVLSPDRFLPSKCTVTGGFSCADYKIDGAANEVRFFVINNLGRDAVDVNVTLSTTDCGGLASNLVALGPIDNGDRAQAVFTCNGALAGVFDGDIDVTYIASGELESHVASGNIRGDVE